MEVLTKVLEGLMSRYKERVADVSLITKALVDKKVIVQQSDIENDHIAFRTMGVPQLGIASFEKIFLHYGYTAQDNYYFENKKVNARWYAPPKKKLPRIFISELIVDDFPKEIKDIIRAYTDEVKKDPVDSLDLDNAHEVDAFLHSALWRIPTWEDYKKLQSVSEYAAWVIYNRYYLNHYTISVHNLPKGYNSLEEFNAFVTSIGIKLSDAGGYIKTSKDGLLSQSSSISEMREATFSGGEKHLIPGSYVEFAERRVLPEYQHLPQEKIKRSYRREGFEAANADKIFESTFSSQTKKNQN